MTNRHSHRKNCNAQQIKIRVLHCAKIKIRETQTTHRVKRIEKLQVFNNWAVRGPSLFMRSNNCPTLGMQSVPWRPQRVWQASFDASVLCTTDVHWSHRQKEAVLPGETFRLQSRRYQMPVFFEIVFGNVECPSIIIISHLIRCFAQHEHNAHC